MKTNTATCDQPLFMGDWDKVQKTGEPGGQELARRWSARGAGRLPEQSSQARLSRSAFCPSQPTELPRDQLSNSPDWLDLQASGRPLGTAQSLGDGHLPHGKGRGLPFFGSSAQLCLT